ncbi:hypothetical protein SAMN05216428_10185 [Nitrosospira sp. Nsp11]|uniref:hypothetical protein n=1 Tax=Nitrosospira sp. Nsp11 TaxID=1855338 RepID=UPI00091B932F|nr:hypothetical protein [Nitrosospira sp. Nsp11]SHL10468.1 hypothetical protein SAMN05216428_10185 [Nitrosospira sp. Nsp11]
MITLTAEQKDRLDNELDTDPKGKGYAGLRVNQPGQVVDLLNAKTEWMHKMRLVTNLTLSSVLGTDLARIIRTKLNALAPSDIVIADFVQAMGAQPGGDIGDPETIKMINILTAQDVFTPEEGAALKALSWQPASTMEVLELPHATEEMIRVE